MEDKEKPKVLVVDDEEVIRDFLSQLLSLHNLGAQVVADGFAAIELAKREQFDLIFIDVRMPRIDGIETLRELKKVNPKAKFVMMTGYAIDELLKESEQDGAVCAIRKPFEIEEILAQIRAIEGPKAI